jgi:hypothetical protein
MVVIRELSAKNLNQAVRIYAQGVLMEVPPGSTDSEETLTKILKANLRRYIVQHQQRQIWLAFKTNTPCGLLDFYLFKRSIRIRFICAIPPRQGTGTHLMMELAKFAIQKRVEKIRSTVSTQDLRAINFYFTHLGFTQTGYQKENDGLMLFLAVIDPKILLQSAASI